MQGLTLLKATSDAFQAHHITTGTWATSFDELAIDIPWTGRTKFVSHIQDPRSNGQWGIGIEQTSQYVTLYAGRISGKYKGAYFGITYMTPNGLVENPTIHCYERLNGANYLFDTSLPAGAFCEKIMKGTLFGEGQWSRNYRLP